MRRGQRRLAGWRRPGWLAVLLSALAGSAALVGLVRFPGGPWPEPVAAAGSGRVGPTTPGRGAAGAPGDEATAEEHLARARWLLERNRADAIGGSKEGLLQAEREVQAELRLGSADQASAWRLLADVSGELASGWAADDRERQGFLQREREALHGLLEAAPTDGGARYRYAMLVADRGQRIEQLAHAARLLPRDPRPRRTLGEELLEAGRKDQGARLLVEAAELCSPEELEELGPDLVRVLRLHGREEEEAWLRERMERLGH